MDWQVTTVYIEYLENVACSPTFFAPVHLLPWADEAEEQFSRTDPSDREQYGDIRTSWTGLSPGTGR